MFLAQIIKIIIAQFSKRDILPEMPVAKKKHGGRRSNSGRKPTGKESVNIRLRPEIHAALKKAAAAAVTSKSEYVEGAVTEKLGKKS